MTPGDKAVLFDISLSGSLSRGLSSLRGVPLLDT